MTGLDAPDERQPDTSKAPRKRKKRLLKKLMVRPLPTRPIIIGFHDLSRGATQIIYTIGSCDAYPLGNLVVSVELGTTTYLSQPEAVLFTNTPAIDVDGSLVRSLLYYKVVDGNTNEEYVTRKSISIPHRKLIPDCDQSRRRVKHR